MYPTTSRYFRTALPGMRFGRLVVHAILPGGRRRCVCDCGAETSSTAASLKGGGARSCGCLRTDIARECHVTHGAVRGGKCTRAYTAWLNMRRRCTSPSHPEWPRYGARGITVCPEWESFAVFLADMNEPPAGLSLERINNDAGYSKANCRWATSREQARNMRSNRRIEFRGETRTLSEWAEVLGIRKGTLSGRLYDGWTVERALMEAVR